LATREPREQFREKPAVLHLRPARQLYRERNCEAAVVERPAELKHSPSPDSQRTSNHVFPSPQSHSSTVSSDGISGNDSSDTITASMLKYRMKCKNCNYNDSNLGSRAAKSPRGRICLASRGWLPIPRRATTAAAWGKGAARQGAGGSVHPGAWMGTTLYE